MTIHLLHVILSYLRFQYIKIGYYDQYPQHGVIAGFMSSWPVKSQALRPFFLINQNIKKAIISSGSNKKSNPKGSHNHGKQKRTICTIGDRAKLRSRPANALGSGSLGGAMASDPANVCYTVEYAEEGTMGD